MKKKFFICLLIAYLSYPQLAFTKGNALNYFQRGTAFFDQGKLDQALTSFQKATQADPNFTEAFYNLGILYDLQGKFSEAVEVYKRVIELDPNMGTVWQNIAQDCNFIGKVREGMDYIKIAESLGKPVDQELYNNMWAKVKNQQIQEKNKGTSSVKRKTKSQHLARIDQELELAIVSLEKELKQKKKKGDDLIRLGIKYRQKGELEKSIDLFTKSLAQRANQALVLAELGLCYYFKGQKNLFVQNFRKAKQAGYKPSKSINDLYLQYAVKK